LELLGTTRVKAALKYVGEINPRRAAADYLCETMCYYVDVAFGSFA